MEDKVREVERAAATAAHSETMLRRQLSEKVGTISQAHAYGTHGQTGRQRDVQIDRESETDIRTKKASAFI